MTKKNNRGQSNNNPPLVSIVTPAYNAERFIEDTLRSVRNQDYPRIEHIVLDDGSTDNTLGILRKYQGKYDLKCISKSNEGQTITVNKGFDLAKGEIVMWLNADDVLFSRQAVSKVVRKFESNPRIGVIYGHMAIIDEKNRIVKIQCAVPWVTFDRLLKAHFAACVFYTKKTVLDYKLNPLLDYNMDYEQCLRMCKDGVRFGYLDEILLAYRRHRNTKSMGKKAEILTEARIVKNKYGEKPGLLDFPQECLDKGSLLIFKLRGVKTAISLIKEPQKSQLAFDAKFDSLIKLIFRQAIPYVN